MVSCYALRMHPWPSPNCLHLNQPPDTWFAGPDTLAFPYTVSRYKGPTGQPDGKLKWRYYQVGTGGTVPPQDWLRSLTGSLLSADSVNVMW